MNKIKNILKSGKYNRVKNNRGNRGSGNSEKVEKALQDSCQSGSGVPKINFLFDFSYRIGHNIYIKTGPSSHFRRRRFTSDKTSYVNQNTLYIKQTTPKPASTLRPPNALFLRISTINIPQIGPKIAENLRLWGLLCSIIPRFLDSGGRPPEFGGFTI